MNVQPHPQMANATFLQWVQGREERYELAGGRVIMMTGGTMRHGQVIGATDRIAGEAVARPVTFGDVYATLFRHLGIDAGQTTVTDLNGRPQYVVEDHAQPLAELASSRQS